MSGIITTFAKATAVVSTATTVKNLITSFSKPKATIPNANNAVKSAAAGAVSSDNTRRLLSKPGNQKVSEKVTINRSNNQQYTKLDYPLDPSPYEIQFNFIKYKEAAEGIEGTRSLLSRSSREIAESDFTKDITTSITLPIPNNIVDVMALNYDQFEQGPFGGRPTEEITRIVAGAADSIATTADLMLRAGESAESRMRMAGRAAAGIGQNILAATSTGLNAIDRSSISAFVRNTITDEAIRGVVGQTLGTIPNPNRSVQFNGVDLRSYEYSWKFMPHSVEESNRLRNIIEAFKYSSLPEVKNRYFLTYPDIVQVKFLRIEHQLFKHKLCFIESVNVNYAPSGQPTFFHQTDAPVEMELSVRLREVSSITREDIGENFRTFAPPLPTTQNF